jgi:hypothetical protein
MIFEYSGIEVLALEFGQRPGKGHNGLPEVTKVTLEPRTAVAARHLIRRYFENAAPRGGTCQKTTVVSICLI